MTTIRSAPSPSRAAPARAVEGFGPPPPPQPARSLAGALLGVVLVVFCAAGVAVYTARAGHRHAVLAVARPVRAGAAIQDADLTEIGLSADKSLRSIPAGQRDRVVGRIAGVNLLAGTLLTTGELATGPQVDADHAIVGLAVKAGQYPNSVRPLDPVQLVDTGGAGTTGAAAATSQPTMLVPDARVTAVDVAADGQATVVSVLVPRRSAPAVAVAAAHGTVSVILLGGSAPG